MDPLDKCSHKTLNIQGNLDFMGEIIPIKPQRKKSMGEIGNAREIKSLWERLFLEGNTREKSSP
jgi:hypothetical protein